MDTKKGRRTATGSATGGNEDVRVSKVVFAVAWEAGAVWKDDELSVDVERVVARRGLMIVKSRMHHVSG